MLRTLLVVIGLIALVGAMAALVSSGSAATGDRLPDEAMTNLRSFHVDTTEIPGHTLLRFTTESVNIGAGPLELRGSRPNTSTSTMSVVQRIYNGSGGFRSRSVPSFMFWAGDGHNHWHVNDFMSTELERMDNGFNGRQHRQAGLLPDRQQRVQRVPSPRAQQQGVQGLRHGGSNLTGRQDGHLGRLG